LARRLSAYHSSPDRAAICISDAEAAPRPAYHRTASLHLALARRFGATTVTPITRSRLRIQALLVELADDIPQVGVADLHQRGGVAGWSARAGQWHDDRLPQPDRVLRGAGDALKFASLVPRPSGRAAHEHLGFPGHGHLQAESWSKAAGTSPMDRLPAEDSVTSRRTVWRPLVTDRLRRHFGY
jgi:hypothetical protein